MNPNDLRDRRDRLAAACTDEEIGRRQAFTTHVPEEERAMQRCRIRYEFADEMIAAAEPVKCTEVRLAGMGPEGQVGT